LSREDAFVVGARLVPLAVAVVCGCTQYHPDSPSCRPRQILATEQMVRALAPEPEQPFGKQPTCRVEPDGSLVLQFVPPSCNPDEAWWAGCLFALGQDMRPFDLVAGGSGVLVARVCVENFVRSTVNLRYGPPKEPSRFLRVISGDEQDFTDGCRTIYLGPEDACYGEGCGRICRPQDLDGSAGAAETLSAGGTTCTDFADSELLLMNEWCQDRGATAPGTITIRLLALTYYQGTCACQGDRDCAAPAVCRNDGWREFSQCSAAGDAGARCPSVCASPAAE
jgi:hypothetical protein